MENKPRILTVCSAPSGYPQVTVGGAWLGEWGFEHGDQVTLTNPENGILVMFDTMPARIWYPQKQLRRLEAEVKRCKKDLAETHWESDRNRVRHELKMAELDLAAIKAQKNIRA